MHPPAPPTVLRRFIYLPIGIGLLTIISLIGYGYYAGELLHEVDSPLLNIIHEVRLESSATRFWIEEALDGEQKLNFDLAWGYLEQAVAYLKSVSESKRTSPPGFPTGDFEDLTLSIERLSSALTTWKELSESIASLSPNMRPSANLRSELTSAFSDFSKAVSEIELKIRTELEKGRALFRSVQTVLIGLLFMLAVGLAGAARRHERERSRNLFQLTEMNRQLREEIARREATECTLADRERRFRLLFESAPDLIQMVDSQGATLLANPAACMRLGFSAEEITGRPLEDFLSPGSRERFAGQFRALIKTGELRAEYDMVARTGAIIPVDCSAKMIQGAGGSVHIVFFQKDITERRTSELTFKAVHRFLIAANRHQELQSMLEDFIDIIMDATVCEAAAVRVEDEALAKPWIAARGFDVSSCLPNRRPSSRLCQHLLKTKVNGEECGYSPNGSFYCNSAGCSLEQESAGIGCPVHRVCGQPSYESFALIPIQGLHGLIGLIHIAYRDKEKVSIGVVRLLEAAALQLGTAIQRVRAEEALKCSHDELENRVQERTEQLGIINERLKAEILERSLTERSLIQHQEQLRKLSSVLVQAEERERHRIATAIHDGVGQTLAAAKIKLGALKSIVAPKVWEGQLGDVRGLLSLAIEETRSLTFELSPSVLYEIGLLPALEWMAERFQHKFGLPVKVEGDGCDRKLGIPHRVFVFQAVRELCLNAAKHAGASLVTVDLVEDGECVRIEVTDDGAGFDVNERRKADGDMGFGLFSIREQLRHYGGAFTTDSHPGKGTRMILRMPILSTTVAKET